MKNIIDKINIKKIIIVYILLQPVIDIITSLCVRNISEKLTLGIVVRTLFMIFVVLYSLLISTKKERKRAFIYYIGIAVYTIIYLIICWKQNGFTMILTQIKGVIKILYMPMVLVSLYNINKIKDIKIENKYFVWILLGYTATMFITRILGIAYPSYEVGYKEGTEGLFFAGNEVGAILGILAPLLFIQFFNKFEWINIISILLLMFSILELGTKVPYFSIIILSVIFFILCIIKLFREENKKNIIIKIGAEIILIFIFGISIGYMPLGKNLNINIVENIKSKFSSSENSEEKQELDDGNKEQIIDPTVMVSGRDEFLKANLDRFKESSILEKIFGNGYLTNKNEELQENKLVEMDIFDIIFNQGILGAILIFLPTIYILILMIIKVFKNLKIIIFKENIILIGYGIAISFAISFMAGHTLVAPAVAIFIVLNIISLNKELEEM